MTSANPTETEDPARPDEAALDAAVAQAERRLARHELPRPTALFLMATGAGILPTRLERAGRLPLERVDGVPRLWREGLLHYGELNGLACWILEDGQVESDAGDPAWARAFPVWLAAAAGASVMIHTSAGHALDATESGLGALPVGSLALLSDHLNLSGATPLEALGESRLGPMFPDLSLLHDDPLRARALATAVRLGLQAVPSIAACTAFPALDTPAERRFYARAGANVAVQGLADPLLAAAHAGLGALAAVVVVAEGDEPVDVAHVAAVAREIAPALDDLLFELSGDVRGELRSVLDAEA